MPNRPKTSHNFIYRCDIQRKGADTVDPEDGTYTIPGEYAAHLTDVFCLYSYDVRRTTGERFSEVRESSTRYLDVFVPMSTDVLSDDLISQVRDKRGNVIIYNDIEIIAVQPEELRNWKRLVCQEIK